MKTSGDKRTSARSETRTASASTTRVSQAIEANAQNRKVGSRSASSPSIEIRINQLVLHGFAHADRRPIAESIERELRVLLTNQDFTATDSFTVEQVTGGSFQIESKRRNESAGANIARAIYGGLRQ